MKRDLFLWQLAGFAVTSLGGTLLHFWYEWSGQSPWVAPFSGVNESTWEHMKLLFYPCLVFSLIQGFFFREEAGFWKVKLRGTLGGLLLIPVLFYTYNGAFGKSPDWLNISIFFVSAASVYYGELRAFRRGTARGSILPLVLLGVLAALFVSFTFAPPELPLFCDPLTGTYGVSYHSASAV